MVHRSGPHGRGALLIGIVTAITAAAILNIYHSSRAPSFCDGCSFEQEITESGRLTYRSGAIIDLYNRYRLQQNISYKDARLRVTGTVNGGQFDKRLRGLVPGDHFDIALDTDAAAELCPAVVSPLYPMALRRVLFLLPHGYAYPGKVWSGSFCEKRLLCRYEMTAADDEGFFTHIDCGGTLSDGTVVELLLQAEFIKEPGRYRSIEGDIRVAAGPLDARWKVRERARGADLSDERDSGR